MRYLYTIILLCCISIISKAQTASSYTFSQTSGIWLDVPFVPQEKNGCGAAVIAMVMDYWSDKALNHHTEATTMLYGAQLAVQVP